MTPRQVADGYFVTPQVAPQEASAIREAGFRTVICNRPDGENPPAMVAAEVRKAVEAEGLTFHEVPFNQQTLNLDIVAQQRALIDSAEGPILAYCASGNRCTIVWGLGEAQQGTLSADEIVAAGAGAGYDLRGLAPTLEALVGQR